MMEIGDLSSDNWKAPGIKNNKIKEGSGTFAAPEGLWHKCKSCGHVLTEMLIAENLFVCENCNYHMRLSALDRLHMFCDVGTFIELDESLLSSDPLEFTDSRSYRDRLIEAQEKKKMNDAFVGGKALLKGRPVQIGAFDFYFMGGSMGTVVGEKIARLFDRAVKAKEPAIIFSASGGARMQEGILSLMQMAKSTVARKKLKEAGLPFISILTDPTTGGVAASYAALGDVVLAEPKALIGFAGPRVIEQTIREELPPGFQRSEFLLNHGLIDQVIARKNLSDVVDRYLTYLC